MNLLICLLCIWFCVLGPCQPRDLLRGDSKISTSEETSNIFYVKNNFDKNDNNNSNNSSNTNNNNINNNSNSSSNHNISNNKNNSTQTTPKPKSKRSKKDHVIRIRNINIYFVNKLAFGSLSNSGASIVTDKEDLKAFKDRGFGSTKNESKSGNGSRSKLFSGFELDSDLDSLKETQIETASKKYRDDLGLDVAPYENKNIKQSLGLDVAPYENKNIKQSLGLDVAPYENKNIKKILGLDVAPHDIESLTPDLDEIKNSGPTANGWQRLLELTELKRKLNSMMGSVERKFPDVVSKLRRGLHKFGNITQKGVELAVEGIILAFKEVKASHIINKLEKRLEQGNEIVDEFFQKVGEKISRWSNPEEKVFTNKYQNNFKQNRTLLNQIFQDQEIHEILNHMVSEGILTDQDVKNLCDVKSQSL